MKFDFSSYIVSVIMLLFNTVYSQDSFEEFQNQQQQAQEQFFEDEISGFQNYVASVTAQYAAYEQQQDREFEQFKEAVEEKWQDFKSPSKKEYVEYDDDLDSRATIDFEKGEITVEVIVEEEVTEPSLEPTEKVEQTTPKKNLIQQEIKKKKMDKEPEPIESIFKKSKKSDPQKTKSQQQPLEEKKKIPDQRLQRKLTDIIKAKGDDGKPMLNKQVADNEGKTVTSTTAKAFASELVANNPVAKKTYKAKDGKKRTVYTVKVPLKSDHVNIRADRYKQEVMKQSKRFNIDPIIAFAVMETESAFNPKAKSHIPAYGLM
ncbi:MAG: murein transglycosylase domain-containing protein, partial [Candidatus Marinimicrobia bacterium]|nr:murein transglycosylase domain-containing protein [Candidatus Neomarinimicrobiota bacterium]